MRLWIQCAALACALFLLTSCGARGGDGQADPVQPQSSSGAEPRPGMEDEEERQDPNWPCAVSGSVIEKKPERVVALNPSVAEILADMGLEGDLAGVGDYCLYPEAVAALPRCGSEIRPDTDAILGLGADLVLSLNDLPPSDTERLRGSGATVVTLVKPDDFALLGEYYQTAARAVAGERDGVRAARDFGEPLAQAYQTIIHAAREMSPRPSGVFAAMLPLTLATGDSPQGKLLSLCGIENMAGEYTEWQYPQELLLPLDPEVLVADTRTLSLDEVREHPNYRSTACVTGGRLLGVDGGAIENGGRRFYQAMLDMARLAGADVPATLEEAAAQPG